MAYTVTLYLGIVTHYCLPENRSSQDDFTVDYKSSDILISKPTGFLDVKNRLGDATFNNPASNMGAILGGVTSYGDTLIIGMLFRLLICITYMYHSRF